MNDLERLGIKLRNENNLSLTRKVWRHFELFLMGKRFPEQLLATVKRRLELAADIVRETEARRAEGVINLTYQMIPVANDNIPCTTEKTILTVWVEHLIAVLNSRIDKPVQPPVSIVCYVYQPEDGSVRSDYETPFGGLSEY